MQSTTRRILAPPEDVFAVLSDGWLYATWVVGASRIRDVDVTWPDPGSSIHHSVGVWPLILDDTTGVVECVPDRRLVLRARSWPAGEAHVDIELTPTADGCSVTITEDAVSGPAKAIPGPVRDVLLGARNGESLQRLAFLAEHGARVSGVG